MFFALLLSRLPHVEVARGQYDDMLALHEHKPGRVAHLWQRIKPFFS
jgi:hypothetical protein